MEGASILETVARLAIGLLGFSGIVVAISERTAGALSSVERARFFTMVLSGALVEVLALLPFPLHYVGLDSHTLWAWTSGAGAVTCLLFTWLQARAAPGVTLRMVWSDASVSKAAVLIGTGLWVASTLILALNAVGIPLEPTFAPYLIAVLLLFGNALLLLLAMAAVTFARLIHSFLIVPSGKQSS